MRVLLICFAVLLASCAERTEVEVAPQNIRPAKIMTIEAEGSDVVHEFTARIEALQTVDLSFEVGGPLAQLPVREGETLEKSTLVAALEPTTFELAVKEAEVQLRLAAQDLNRKRKVLAENGIAKSLVEDARSHYELQRVRLNRARESLADARIYAPFDGAYVSQRYFDQHVNIRPGDPIVRLLDLTRLQVVINIPETLLATVSAEQVVESWVELPFAGDNRFPITYKENRGEAAAVAQTYEVSFLMDNPSEWNVLPGMTATASIHLRGLEEGQLFVPASAVIPAPDGSFSVWVYNPADNSVERRAVTTLTPRANGVPVSAGLSAGEQIVITGASQLQAGMKVRPL